MLDVKLTRRLFLKFFLFAFGTVAFSQSYSLNEIVSSEIASQLLSKGEIKNTIDDGSQNLLLMPNTPVAKKTIQLDNDSESDAPYSLEALYYVKKSDLKGKSKNPGSTFDLDQVSVILRSVSKMEGMEYSPNNNGKTTVLYTESYVIANQDSKDPIPDKTDGSADGLKLYFFQDQDTFGPSRYEATYLQSDSEVSLRSVNLDALKYGIITAVKKNNMAINIVVTDCGDAFLVYMFVQMKIARVSVIENMANKSLTARLDATSKWFINQF